MRKKLLYAFIFTFLLMSVIYKLTLNYNKDKYTKELLIESNILYNSTNESFEKFIDLVKIRLDAISFNKEFKDYLKNKENKQNVEELFLSLIKQTPSFSQLRYIDISGNEIIRVDQNEFGSLIVDDIDLQNKSDRYYFKKTINLKNESYFISKLDLNTEYGKIETPYTPTIRITKLLKNENKNIGMLILNVNMAEFIDNLLRNKKFEIYLIDKDNYLLASNTKDKQWERYLEDDKFDKSHIYDNAISYKLNLQNEDNPSLVIKINDNFFDKFISDKMVNVIILLIIFYHLIVIIIFFRIYQIELEQKIKKAVEENLKKEKLLSQQQKLASMGEMLENIAHQWRQPLNMISTLSSGLNLKLQLDCLDRDDQSKAYDEIMKQTTHLSKTIDTFRNFIKEEKDYTVANIEDRIKLTLEILNATFKDNNIVVTNKINFDEKHKIKLVLGELSQVIINIVNNAKDVFKERKINSPILELDLKVNENKLILTIEDNAGGIREDILPRIFEPYFTTKDESQGTGIGLHMAYRIMKESFKGDIYVQNTLRGAKFFIEIPIAE
jgi:signal transduction histidine kinase